MSAQRLSLSLWRLRLAGEPCYYAAASTAHSHTFSTTLPTNDMIPLSIPAESELGGPDDDSEFENERRKKNSFGSIPHARDGAELSPPSSPADDVDLESLASQHLHPGTSSINTYADQAAVRRGHAESPTPSLVPTEPASRSPSPGPHPCVAELERQGIKVRDFAYEEHAVPLARVVPDVDLLKSRYELYRSANLSPPREVVEGLDEYDQPWLNEKKAFYDNRELMNYP